MWRKSATDNFDIDEFLTSSTRRYSSTILTMSCCPPLSADVLSEEAILKWYSQGQQNKGKGMFLEQMKKFVEWLKNAEEGERSGFWFFFSICGGKKSQDLFRSIFVFHDYSNDLFLRNIMHLFGISISSLLKILFFI